MSSEIRAKRSEDSKEITVSRSALKDEALGSRLSFHLEPFGDSAALRRLRFGLKGRPLKPRCSFRTRVDCDVSTKEMTPLGVPEGVKWPCCPIKLLNKYT